MRYKYPRTFHLPWSEGCTDDDKIMDSTAAFEGREVIVTEKMDGENTTLYHDGLHARSIDSGYHPSRTWVQNWWSSISYNLPSHLRICGENVYARHSISYHDLPHFFLAFSVWEGDRCWGWDATTNLCAALGVHLVPVLYEGVYDERKIRSLYREETEGYVIRTRERFAAESFSQSVGKFVRKGHVTTDDHWMHQAIIPNELTR